MLELSSSFEEGGLLSLTTSISFLGKFCSGIICVFAAPFTCYLKSLGFEIMTLPREGTSLCTGTGSF